MEKKNEHFKQLSRKLLGPLVCLIVLLFGGCKSAENNNSLLLEELNKSLAQSNGIIQNNTNVIVESLASKTVDPPWSELAILWKERADSVRSKCDLLIKLLDDLRATIGIGNSNVSRPGVSKLYSELKSTREKILSIHPDIDREFRGLSSILCHGMLQTLKNEDAFYTILFDNNDSIKLKNLLLKFENDVRTTEYKLVNFCYNMVGGCILTYDKFHVIVNQNSTHFKPGEELLVQAGIGQFGNHSKPRFTINHQVIEADNGVPKYKLKVGNGYGRYSIPIRIDYYSPDGREQVFQDSVRYYVDE